LRIQQEGEIVFDVSGIFRQGYDLDDVDTSQVEAGMLRFYKDLLEGKGTATPKYFHDHPQLFGQADRCAAVQGFQSSGLIRRLRNGKRYAKGSVLRGQGWFVVEKSLAI
jgi:hypothetical protein